jgi:hypothetical protein
MVALTGSRLIDSPETTIFFLTYPISYRADSRPFHLPLAVPVPRLMTQAVRWGQLAELPKCRRDCRQSMAHRSLSMKLLAKWVFNAPVKTLSFEPNCRLYRS